MFKNDLGFTLVEAMLAVAISTGSALVVYKIIGESQKGQAVVENRDEVNQLHRELVGKFTDRTICTATMMEPLSSASKSVTPIKEIFNQQGKSLFKFPNQRGRINVLGMAVTKFEKEKNQAEILTTFSYGAGSGLKQVSRNFMLELAFKDGAFESCVTRGTTAIDQKDACDLVIGLNEKGESYFFNGKCNFAQAACEQSGRVWNESDLRCDFSKQDLLSVRKEVCELFNMNFSEADNKCIANEAMIKAFNEMSNVLEAQKNK